MTCCVCCFERQVRPGCQHTRATAAAQLCNSGNTSAPLGRSTAAMAQACHLHGVGPPMAALVQPGNTQQHPPMPRVVLDKCRCDGSSPSPGARVPSSKHRMVVFLRLHLPRCCTVGSTKVSSHLTAQPRTWLPAGEEGLEPPPLSSVPYIASAASCAVPTKGQS